MRLSAAVPGATLDEKLTTLRSIEISATDLWFNPDTVLPDAAGIRQTFQDHDATLAQVSCYTNLECAPGAIRDRQMARLRELIDWTAAAGGRVVVSGCGHMNPDNAEEVFSAHPDNWTPAAMDRLVETCAEAAGWAAEAGITFAVESWVLLTLNSPKKIRELVDRVNNPALGVLFDPVNLMNLDVHFTNGEMIREAFDLLGDRIKIVHAKDTIINAAAFTYHMSEAQVGKGRLDYDTLLRCMSELSDPDTPLHIEHLSRLDEVISARDHLRTVAARVGVKLA